MNWKELVNMKLGKMNFELVCWFCVWKLFYIKFFFTLIRISKVYNFENDFLYTTLLLQIVWLFFCKISFFDMLVQVKPNKMVWHCSDWVKVINRIVSSYYECLSKLTFLYFLWKKLFLFTLILLLYEYMWCLSYL